VIDEIDVIVAEGIILRITGQRPRTPTITTSDVYLWFEKTVSWIEEFDGFMAENINQDGQ